MFKKKILIFSFGLAILLVLCSTTGVIADSDKDQIDLNGMTLSEIEELFPMSAEAEAAIVHTVPEVPIVIDDIQYEPEEITLFNGQRLRFVIDNDGVLNAFTTVEGLEQFIAEEFGQPEPSDTSMEIQSQSYGRFWEHAGYSGSALFVGPGIGISDLGFFNDMISSAQVDQELNAGILFEDTDYHGSYFYIPGGTKYYLLIGFNDRASSLMVF